MQTKTNNTISRSHFLRSVGIITEGILIKSSSIFAQTSPVVGMKNAAAKASIIKQSLRGNICVLEGAGGNIALFTGTEGKMMVDCGIDVSQKKISKAIADIGSAPLKYLVNTHWHFDHAGGNEWFQREVATMVAHENTRKHLSVATTIKDFNYTFLPAPKNALPTTIFQDEHVMKFNGSEIKMKHYSPAHTDSDISVYFSKADILHVGDTWGNGSYPFIDHSSGGTLDGMVNAANHNMEITTDKTIIIPVHGPIGNRQQLMEYRDMLVDVRENVSKLKKSGRSLKGTIAAKPTAAYDEKWGKAIVGGGIFTMLVYADV
ncbi:MAG: MBL fold metallo-hydrolase [Rhizobacter sp.]|nr:MBL fold metallo-hydrolase [Ferruginibacter sp.]